MYIKNSSVQKANNLILAIEEEISSALASGSIDISLCSGLAGIALFYAKLAASSPNPQLDQKLSTLEDRIYGYCEESNFRDIRLFSGLCGVGFAMEYIGKMQGRPVQELDEINEDLDRILIKILDKKWPGHYDLVGGLIGIGTYTLSRTNSASQRSLFSKIYSQIKQFTVDSTDGLAAITPQKFFGYESRNAKTAEGNFNLGLAHGNAGLLLFLVKALKNGMEKESISHDLNESAKWLISKRQYNLESSYGYVAGEKNVSRLAWCYGDLAVALALIRGGGLLSNRNFIDNGIDIAERACARSVTLAKVHDHGLCHGYSGVGLMFSAINREIENPLFRSEAERWYEYSIQEGMQSLQGFKTLRDDGTRELELGALSGLSGVGLALLDAMQPETDGWSDWLLL